MATIHPSVIRFDRAVREVKEKNVISGSDSYVTQLRNQHFFRFEDNLLRLFFELKMQKDIGFYLYVISNITRGTSGYPWWTENVLPFYQKGLLPFAKHNSHMAKDCGCSAQTIARKIKKLLDNGFIIKIGEPIAYPRRPEPIIVYSLGEHFIDGHYTEVFYSLHKSYHRFK